MWLNDRISVHSQRTRPLPLPFVMIVLEPGKKKRLNGQDTEIKNYLAGGDFLDIQRRKTNVFLYGLYSSCQINQSTQKVHRPAKRVLTSILSPFLSAKHSDEPEPGSEDNDKPNI